MKSSAKREKPMNAARSLLTVFYRIVDIVTLFREAQVVQPPRVARSVTQAHFSMFSLGRIYPQLGIALRR
jgi:hypothetical protein